MAEPVAVIPVHSDPLTVSARPILQPPDDKFTIAGFFRVDSPRLASIGGQSKKLKISTFGWGMVGCLGRYFWDLEGG